MSGILRVFQHRTSHTPDDGMVAIGQPSLFVPECEAVHVSVTFSWQMAWARAAAEQWRLVTGNPVQIGGPGCPDSTAGEFTPGMYVKQGITYTTRGCPNACPWCLVSQLEGQLRCLKIKPGHRLQDNNLTAAPISHFRAVCAMLKEQSKAAVFAGGLEAARLTENHLAELKQLRIREIWTAADDGWNRSIERAIKNLRSFLSRDKVRCYALIGYNEWETCQEAEDRLRHIWDAGAMPFAQLYRGPKESKRRIWPKEWRDLARRWSRPAIMKART